MDLRLDVEDEIISLAIAELEGNDAKAFLESIEEWLQKHGWFNISEREVPATTMESVVSCIVQACNESPFQKIIVENAFERNGYEVRKDATKSAVPGRQG